jgi:exodeoxyribonuclease VIII
MDYIDIKALSYSGAKHLLRSPAHYQAWLTAEQKDTPALKLGRLAHLAALQPDLCRETVFVAPDCDRRTKAGKETYEAFVSGLPLNAEVIDADTAEKIAGIAKAAHGAFAKLGVSKEHYIAEQAVFGQMNGVDIKGRPDLVTKIEGSDAEYIIDIKTCQSADHESFARDVANYKYHLQAAFYGALRNTGRNFIIVAIEKEPPYAWRIYTLNEETYQMGVKLMNEAVNIYKMCNLFNTWSGYTQEVSELTLPKWAINLNAGLIE